MPQPTTYEIILRGRPSRRLLHPLLDHFSVEQHADGTTRLIGAITDASQLHGVISHVTSMSVDVISIGPVRPADGDPHRSPAAEPRRPHEGTQQ